MDHESEKARADHIGEDIDRVKTTASVPPYTEHDFNFTPSEERRIIKRIDRRLITTVGFMYCVSLSKQL